MVLWPSGQAQLCKSCYSGSNPLGTSKNTKSSSSNLSKIQDLGETTKSKFHNTLFLNGLVYDSKFKYYRTTKVNSVIVYIVFQVCVVFLLVQFIHLSVNLQKNYANLLLAAAKQRFVKVGCHYLFVNLNLIVQFTLVSKHKFICEF